MLVFELLLVVLFGFFLAVFASFFEVVMVRTARGESFTQGRSKCDHCHHKIDWYDNIPILSFLWLRGRCRYCQQPIAKTYFWTEVVAFLFGVVFYLVYISWPFLQTLPIAQVVLYFLFSFILFFVLLADLKYLLVPDLLVGLLTVLALLLQFYCGTNWILPVVSVLFSIIFFLLLSFVAKKIFKKEALGLGDVKLMIPLSLLLSWPKTALSIFLAFIIGGIFAMLMLLTGRKKFGQVLPFAPFLILAAVISFGFGEAIWQWYFAFLL